MYKDQNSTQGLQFSFLQVISLYNEIFQEVFGFLGTEISSDITELQHQNDKMDIHKAGMCVFFLIQKILDEGSAYF